MSLQRFYGLRSEKSFLSRHFHTTQLDFEPQTDSLAYLSAAVNNGTKRKMTNSSGRRSTSRNMQAAIAVLLYMEGQIILKPGSPTGPKNRKNRGVL